MSLESILSMFGNLGIGQALQKGGVGQIAKLGGYDIGGAINGKDKPESPTSMIDPALMAGGAIAGAAQPSWLDRNSAALGKFGDMASAWGAGVSKASGPSATPISFGQAMAGGSDALAAQKKGDIENRLNEAKIGQAGQIDLEKTADQALVKLQQGLPLTPQETATLQAQDAKNQSKLTYSQDKFGQFVPHPAARSLLPPNMGGQMAQQPGSPQGAPEGQSPRQGLDPSQFRGYFQYLQQKAAQ